MNDLVDRVALVTGGATGIGAAITRRLIARGANVVCCYHRSKDAAEALESEMNRAGRRLLAVQTDVCDAGQIAAAIQSAIECFGNSPDILVNNAGDIVKVAPLEEVSELLWDQVMDVNLKSVFLCSKLCYPAMKDRRRGRIINVSSLAARAGGGPGCLPYAVSKGGVETFTRGFAKEAAPFNVTVNAVAPGLTDTSLIRRFDVCGGVEQLLPRIPLGRLATADDVAAAVAFLASDHASYITGETIAINGGLRMD